MCSLLSRLVLVEKLVIAKQSFLKNKLIRQIYRLTVTRVNLSYSYNGRFNIGIQGLSHKSSQ